MLCFLYLGHYLLLIGKQKANSEAHLEVKQELSESVLSDGPDGQHEHRKDRLE